MGWLRRLIDSLAGVSLEVPERRDSPPPGSVSVEPVETGVVPATAPQPDGASPEPGSAAAASSSDSTAAAASSDPTSTAPTDSPEGPRVSDDDDVEAATALEAAGDLPEEWQFLKDIMPGEELNALLSADSMDDMDELRQQWGVRAELDEERWDFEDEDGEELQDAAAFHDRLVSDEVDWGDEDDEWDDEIEDDESWEEDDLV
jgi:hypothetical protein